MVPTPMRYSIVGTVAADSQRDTSPCISSRCVRSAKVAELRASTRGGRSKYAHSPLASDIHRGGGLGGAGGGGERSLGGTHETTRRDASHAPPTSVQRTSWLVAGSS